MSSGCPTPNGFFADAKQCDKYYHCVDNVLTEKLCPDGMAFNDLNPKVEKCDFHFQVNCDERPELRESLLAVVEGFVGVAYAPLEPFVFIMNSEKFRLETDLLYSCYTDCNGVFFFL